MIRSFGGCYMFCPNCSEPKANDETVFCTKCGLDLGGLDAFVRGDGFRGSKRHDAVKQGFVLIMIGVLLIPVWMFIGAAFPPDDRFVESSPSTTWPEMLAWIGMWIFFIAAFARIGYAAIVAGSERADLLTDKQQQAEPSQLNAGDNFRAAKSGGWRESTADLFEPAHKPQRHSGEL